MLDEKEYGLLGKPGNYPVGSERWLIATEKMFGGRHADVPRRIISPHDPRPRAALGNMIGGDRMHYNQYAEQYSCALAPFVVERYAEWTIVEIGVLRGTGLAMWSMLFPNARIIGLDIDLRNFQHNLANLRERGAFSNRPPEVYRFDQFVDGRERLGRILAGSRIDIGVDDASHHSRAIRKSFRAARPFFAESFVYFIEDNNEVAPRLAKAHPGIVFEQFGYLTVCTRSRNRRLALPGRALARRESHGADGC